MLCFVVVVLSRDVIKYSRRSERKIHSDSKIFSQQDFCKPTNWPPLGELKIVMGGEGEACVEACLKKQLTCEPKFFTSINTKETLER